MPFLFLQLAACLRVSINTWMPSSFLSVFVCTYRVTKQTQDSNSIWSPFNLGTITVELNFTVLEHFKTTENSWFFIHSSQDRTVAFHERRRSQDHSGGGGNVSNVRDHSHMTSAKFLSLSHSRNLSVLLLGPSVRKSKVNVPSGGGRAARPTARCRRRARPRSRRTATSSRSTSARSPRPATSGPASTARPACTTCNGA